MTKVSTNWTTVKAALAPKVAEPEGVRAVFISDVHLGTAGCQADALLDFLKAYPSQTLYLVGDIIDDTRCDLTAPAHLQGTVAHIDVRGGKAQHLPPMLATGKASVAP